MKRSAGEWNKNVTRERVNKFREQCSQVVPVKKSSWKPLNKRQSKTLRNKKIKKNKTLRLNIVWQKLFPLPDFCFLLECAGDLYHSLRMIFSQALTEIGRKADIELRMFKNLISYFV